MGGATANEIAFIWLTVFELAQKTEQPCNNFIVAQLNHGLNLSLQIQLINTTTSEVNQTSNLLIQMKIKR